MPVTLTLAESSSTTTAASTLTTGTIAASGSVVLLWASCGLASTTLASVSGLGLTWSVVQTGEANNATGSLWVGVGTPTTGAITGSWGASVPNQIWHVVDVRGSSGVSQSAVVLKGWSSSSMTATLPNAVAAGSVTLGAYVSNVGTGNPTTAGSGFTVLDDTYVTGPANELLTEYAAQAQSALIDTSGAKAALIAVELTESTQEHHTGSSTATTSATATGSGSKATSGGAQVSASASPEGSGVKATSDGSTVAVTASTSGSGDKHTAGTAILTATTSAMGAGVKVAASSSIATATVTATGAGHGEHPGRDIDVWASPTYTGWQAGLVTTYPETTGPIFQGDEWQPGPTAVNPETAGQLVNTITAGPCWVQEQEH